MSVLEAIISPPKRRNMSKAELSTFKRCLSKVPVTAKVYIEDGKRIVAVRPKNCVQFVEVLKAEGLGYSEILNELMLRLNTNPLEDIKFATYL